MHRHPNVKACSARHPRFFPPFTHTSASSPNMVERSFRSILPPCTEANVGPNHSKIPCRRFDSVPATMCSKACSNAGRFCRRPRKAVSAAGSPKAQACDSLSIVLSPPLLATRMDESLRQPGLSAGSSATTTATVRRLRSRHLGAPGHSSTTFVSSIIRRRGRMVFRCADPGRACTGSPRENRPARTWPVRLQARHARPFCTKARRSPLPCPIHSVV